MNIKHYLLILMMFLFSSTYFAQEGQIVWEKDYKKAVALARESGRPLLLDFTADWCKPCKMMDAQFWVLPDVVESVKPFIAVKINFDNEKSLVGKYRVSAIPFVVFTDPLGNMITFRRGFSSKNVAELNQIFDEMPKDFTPLKKYYEAVEAKKDDGTALLQIADAYRGAKMLRLSNDFYRKALKSADIQKDVEQKERVMTTIGVNAFNYADYQLAIDTLEDYLKEFPQGKNVEVATYVLAVSNARIGKLKNADKYLNLLKSQFPASKLLQSAEKLIQEAKNLPK